jgi:hypothetical protein
MSNTNIVHVHRRVVSVLTSIGRPGEKKLHSLASSVRIGHVRGHLVQPAATKRRSRCRFVVVQWD